MFKHLVILILFLSGALSVQSQITYSLKAEAGYLNYRNNTVQVDPGPGWLGYNLDEQNGVEVSVINGFSFKERLYTGVGISYLNFEGVNGLSVYPDVEYLVLKSRVSPLINLRVGYNHLWNQYDGGTGTTVTDIGLGINCRLKGNKAIYIKSGYLWMQQSRLVPLRIGIRF